MYINAIKSAMRDGTFSLLAIPPEVTPCLRTESFSNDIQMEEEEDTQAFYFVFIFCNFSDAFLLSV